MSDDPFVGYFASLSNEDTGTLAEYRRGCGERWAVRAPQHARFTECRAWLASDFLALGLAAQYSSETIKKSGLVSNKDHKARVNWPFKDEGNIGAAWAVYCKKRKPEDDPHVFYKTRQDKLARGEMPANIPSVHERFRTLLDAELELDGTGELAYRLRGLVRMLVAEDIPIDVIQLARDLRAWRAASRHVQERWAKAFYAPPYQKVAGAGEASTEDDQESEPDNEEDEDIAD